MKKQYGKYIKYIPDSGNYAEEFLNKEYTGSSENKAFQTDTSLNWRIWSVDDEKITLISDKPISTSGYKNLGAISFTNCNGYNNAVKILNDICLACYSNNELGAVSRSINIDDVESVLDKSFWKPEDYKVKNTECYTYSGRKEYVVTKCYPEIFAQENYSIIDGIEKTNGINRSEQSKIFDSSQTFLKAENNLKPLQTAWTKSKMNMKNFIDEKYFYMLFRDGVSQNDELMSYFLASRAVNLNENNVQFDLFEVGMGSSIKTNTLFNSRGGSLEYWDRIRPMVEIPRNNMKIEKINDGLTPDSAWGISGI